MRNRDITLGSGNVFTDLGLPHSDDLLAKAELAARLSRKFDAWSSARLRVA